MQVFECIAASNSYTSDFAVQPNREVLWSAAFGVESLEGLFDMTPAEEAIPVVDAAVRRFNDDPNSLRPLVARDDRMGLRGNRGLLLQLRAFLAEHGGTISGAVEKA